QSAVPQVSASDERETANVFGADAQKLEAVTEATAEDATAHVAAQVFAAHLVSDEAGAAGVRAPSEQSVAHVAALLRTTAQAALNPRRALALTARVAASLDKAGVQLSLTEADLRALVLLCGASELFGEMLASSPALVTALRAACEPVALARDYRAILRREIDRERSFAAELTAVRRAHAQLILEIGARDASGTLAPGESNRLQTELAVASINAGYLIARRELARRYGRLDAGPRLAVLGLGRLASGGMDYGSDLDLVLVYDNQVPSPIGALTRDEAYARLGELLTAALSSITREGHLYRVDLRLRPDGQ